MASFAARLRRELARRNAWFAKQNSLSHAESFGDPPAIIYSADAIRRSHGNFHPKSYAAIQSAPAWSQRLAKHHAQRRSLPPKDDGHWAELDSCNSSDALLMNIFCHPKTLQRPLVLSMLGLSTNFEDAPLPEFGVRARVPLMNGGVDRTEIDMRVGDLLVEAKLTEANFQTKPLALVERYRDLREVFDVSALPLEVKRPVKVLFAGDGTREISIAQWPTEKSEDAPIRARNAPNRPPKVKSYQLIRNVLAAYRGPT